MNAYNPDTPTRFQPDSSNTRTLRDAFSRFATGVTVVTCPSELGPVAITANSFSSVSLEPPLILWAASQASRRFPSFQDAEHFAVHVLAAEQHDLCEQVASDGFALKDMDHLSNSEHVPLIPGCLACFECRTHAIHPAGDHAVILGEVLRVEYRPGNALAFFGGNFAQLAQP